MVASFEKNYPPAELLLIIDLTRKDARKHPLRKPATDALIPILGQLNILKEETDIAPEKYTELFKEYKRLSRAVGILHNDNKVYHDR